MTVLAPGISDFLREANVASLATSRADGRPHVTPVWYEYDGKEFVVSSLRTTQKMKNIARKSFAALCIYSQEMPYRQVIVEGPARAGSPVDNVWRERVATRYLGETAGRAYVRESGDWDVIAIHIRPLKWITEGFDT